MATSRSVSATVRAGTSALVTKNNQAETAELPPDPKPAAEPVAIAESVATDTSTVELAISSIRLDGGTQSRSKLSTPTIGEYADAMKAGAKFPPPVVFYDGKTRWLADGFHRVSAHTKCGRARIECEVRQGSQRDAILFGLKANATHGLRRTQADKRHAVDLLLRDSKWSTRTDRWIGEACGVGHQLVAARRTQLGESSSSAPRVGKDGKARKLPKRARPAAPEFSAPIEIMMVPTDEPGALAELERDIERHMHGWTWTPERFASTLETWAQLARDHFSTKEAANG